MSLRIGPVNRLASIAVVVVAYVGTIVAANWAVATYGAIPVGFGLLAPAGVLFAGLAFTLRDLLHDAAGPVWTIAAILAGTGLSFAVAGPGLAIAAGTAFLVSELADLAVYAPLRRRRWLLAVALSNVVGLVVDSALFLWLAFGSLVFFPGQVVGKAWMTLAAVAVLAFVRGRRREAVA
ncbi:VUT family protein [Micromonospora sp. WMMD1102]|uniref:VUT family protein n=1 Tax=Micromonospora sp. WMMD1102 TaxID=3016105 RepID=UPI00241580AD|nr:VUT family protein [Micromonospora sp. WMMD1102]MDG4791929.1 VUT family protein [Micromonospora sp. WMMD1102]